ncbi:MAG TPA: polysaccharide deacetylase family protein [Devosiaceae bacterium]|jgi:peptidoglycan/xylan/chitin deacetylase (PgdA/CDA1 family)
MAGLKYFAIRAMFELLALSQAPAAIRSRSRSKGVIFTLHRVLPQPPAEFSPNAILQITPDFLDYAIQRVRELDIDIVSLDEAIRRIETPEATKSFAVFTFDDAYRDNLQYALPILQRRQCPFTLYVPTALVDGVGEVWWQALEDIVARQQALAIRQGDETMYYPSASRAEKQAAYDVIYARMRTMPEADRVTLIRDLGRDYGLDIEAHCRALIMNWAELKTFADNPLCTIGAHTVHHYELAKLTPEAARHEIEQSVRIIKAQFGEAPQHLSYPIGGTASAGPREYALARELGLRSAVTTLPAGLYHEDKDRLHALPRISLNGLFQARRYVDVFATGAIFSSLGRIAG